MNLNSNLITLFKASVEESILNHPYDEALCPLGLVTVIISPVCFEWQSLSTLQEKLCASELFSGMILTSQRAVNAIMECLNATNDTNLVLSAWKTKNVFVVGPATHKATLEVLGLDGKGKESGSAEKLAKYIIKYFSDKCRDGLPLLFPCSSLKQATLPSQLASQGFTLDCVECYQTKPDPYLEINLMQLFKKQGIPAFYVFFSPSGVQAVLPQLRQLLGSLQDSKIVSVGPATTAKLESLGHPCAAEASSPDPQGLAEVIRHLLTVQNDNLGDGDS